jgi:indolepyruvate ferredoxin oxidoreductase, beta subunit
MENGITSILLAGVGGQGIIRASDILCLVMMAAGLDVKKSEVHGMAQRGGCVTSHVRYGEKVYSPLAKKGDVDILVSFEKLETLRYLDYVHPEGMVIINEEELYPPAVNLGLAAYPEDIEAIVRQRFARVKVLNAAGIAIRAGNAKAANTALLGALSTAMSVSQDLWEEVLRGEFPEKALEANLTAFRLGREA